MRYGHERYTARKGWTPGGVEGWVERMVQSGYRGRRGRDEDGDWGTERERERIYVGHERASEQNGKG